MGLPGGNLPWISMASSNGATGCQHVPTGAVNTTGCDLVTQACGLVEWLQVAVMVPTTGHG